MNFSLTIGGLLSMGVVHVLSWAGFTTGQEEVDHFIKVASELVAAGIIWYGRWRQGDVYWWGGKK